METIDELAAFLTTATVDGILGRLKYCGIDFEELLDETRRSEALRLISEGKHTMTDNAYRIGYSDPAHFTRAFRRWTGVPPSRFSVGP